MDGAGGMVDLEGGCPREAGDVGGEEDAVGAGVVGEVEAVEGGEVEIRGDAVGFWLVE